MPDFEWFAKKPHSTTSDLQPHQQPKMEDLDHVPGGEDAQTETTPSEAKMQRDTAAANDLIKQVVGSKLRESGDDPEARAPAPFGPASRVSPHLFHNPGCAHLLTTQ